MRASLNLSAFRYAYDNLQLSGVAIVQGVPRFSHATNAGEASVKGLEVEGALQAGCAQGRLSYDAGAAGRPLRCLQPGRRALPGRATNSTARRAPSLTLGYEHGFALRDGIADGRRVRAPQQRVDHRRAEPAAALPDSGAAPQPTCAWAMQPANSPWSVLLRVKNLENKVEPVNDRQLRHDRAERAARRGPARRLPLLRTDP